MSNLKMPNLLKSEEEKTGLEMPNLLKKGAGTQKAPQPSASLTTEAWQRATPSQTNVPVRTQQIQQSGRSAGKTVEKQTLTERIGNTASGAMKQWGGGFVNALGTTQAVTGGVMRKNSLQTDKEQLQKELARYEYEAAQADTPEDRTYWEMEAQKARKSLAMREQGLEETKTAGQATQKKADALSASGTEDVQKAKEGLGKVGSTLVDIGAAGIQMGADIGTGLLTGGSALVPMAVRGFGGSAQEARQEGATLGQQVGYGLGSAAVSVATEKLSNVVKPFAKAFGAGVSDDLVESAISRAVSRAAKTAAGKTALEAVLKTGAGFLGEGTEEFLEDVANPILKRMTYDKNAQFDLEEAAYDFLIGGALGGLGGAVEGVTGAKGKYQGYQTEVQNAAIDNAYDTMKEKGMFSQEGRKAVKDAEDIMPKLDPGGNIAWGRMMQQVAPEKQEAFAQAREIASRFGADLTVEKLENGAAGQYQNNVVTIDPTEENPVRQVLVHELTHHMETSGLYGDFSQKVLGFIAEDMGVDVENLTNSIIREYGQYGVELDADGAGRELVAKFAEEKLFRDERSIQRLLQTDRNLFQRIYDWIRDAVAKVKGTSEEQFLIDAQRLYEKALRQAGTQQGAETAQNTFAGVNARTADLNALRTAQELERQGTDADAIRRQTGWFRGMDGKWRFEIDDSGMSYYKGGDALMREVNPNYAEYRDLELRMLENYGTDRWGENEKKRFDYLKEIYKNEPRRLRERVKNGNATLEDIVKHDKLFAAYPELKNVNVRFKNMEMGRNGYYDRKTNTVVLNTFLWGQPENVIIHEVQHAIQQMEEFTNGSSPGYWEQRINNGLDIRENDQRIQKADAEYQRIFNQAPEDFKNKIRELNRAVIAKDYDTVMAIEDELYASEYADLYSELSMADFTRRGERGEKLRASDLYRNTAGEIEARDVAARRQLTPEQRELKMPTLGDENTVFADGVGEKLYVSMDNDAAEPVHQRPYYDESVGDLMLRDAEGNWQPRTRFIRAEAERSVSELGERSPFSDGFDTRIREDQTVLKAISVEPANVNIIRGNNRNNLVVTDTARRSAAGAGFETGEVRNVWTGLDIQVGKDFYSETATNSAQQRNASSAQALGEARELMKNAYLIGAAEVQIDAGSNLKKKNNPHRLFQYVFAAPYEMDGPKIAVLRVDVMENQGDALHRAYNLRSVEYKNTPLGWAGGEELRAGFQDQTTASEAYAISVADLVKNIKEEYVGNHVDVSGGTDKGQFSMGRSFSELVQNQRDGVEIGNDGQFGISGFETKVPELRMPKLEDPAEKVGQKQTRVLPGDSETDGYMDALAQDENELVDPVTPADIVYDAKLRGLQQEEAPPERQRELVAKRDLDELVQLYQDIASPVETARSARLQESEGLISARTNKEQKSIRDKAREARSYFMRKMVDAGDSVTKMGNAVKDSYLYPFYNMARSSASAGVNMIQNEQTDITGKKVGLSLNDIFNPIREQGDAYYEQFQTYMFDLHNIDRMSLVSGENTAKLEAEMALHEFDRENPDIATLTEARLQRKANSIDPEEAALAKERIRLLRKLNQADKMGNKPVFGYEVTADMSKERADRLLREHPEFKQYQEQVRTYIRNLMQYRVDSGLMTAEDAAFLEKYYPNYVPTFRTTEKPQKGRNRKSVQVGRTVGLAQGGNQKLVPLHEALGKQTMQVVREGGKNRFGARLLEDFSSNSQNEKVRRYILGAQEYESDFSTETFDQPDAGLQKSNTFAVYKDGKKYEMTLDPSMFDAVKALYPDAQESNIAIKAIRAGNNLFKALVTGYNPTFTVRNTVRDLQTAGLYSRDAAAFAKNYPLALKEIATNGDYWKQYKALGGSFSSVFDYQTGTVSEPDGKVAKLAAKMEAVNMAMEQAPRLAEFMSVVKAGDGSMENLMDAMYAAADVTVNFGRAGTLGKVLNANFVPFLNPGIQGFDKMIRRVTETKGSKEWAKLVVRATVLGVAPTIINGLLYSDDEDWEDLKDSDKDTNYLFKIGDGVWLKVPKGRELSILGMAADRIQDIAKGENVNWSDFITTVGNQVAPANPLRQNILAAWFDTALFDDSNPGRTWYGGNIESQRLQNYAPGERYDSSTDVFSKWIGKQLNLSPKKINYLLDQYSGVVGDFLLPLLTPQAERDPFTKAFTVDSVSSNRISGDFYDKSDELTYAKNGGDVSAKVASRFWNRQQTACSNIYQEIRDIENSNLTDAEKKQKVREARAILNGIQKNALSVLDTYQTTVEKYLRGTSDEDLDYAYREANRECFGAEYALQVYNKDTYAKAQEARKNGVSYDDFYTYYFVTKLYAAGGGKSVDTKKMEYLEKSKMSVKSKAELYFADIASDSDLKKQVELEKSSGITAVQYWQYKVATAGMTKKAEKLEAIDSLNLTSSQKTALYYANNWAESTLDDAPWYGRSDDIMPKLSGGRLTKISGNAGGGQLKAIDDIMPKLVK